MTDTDALRAAFGSFMTGVTVVTTTAATGEPVGFTANSFTSVSLQPPLLLVSLSNTLNCIDAFAATDHFAVNILSANQQSVSNTFASFDGDRFDGLDYQISPNKNPLLAGVAAWFDCTIDQRVIAGDHTLYIGQIEEFEHLELDGLGYARHGYFSLQHERMASELHQSSSQLTTGYIIEVDAQIIMVENNGKLQLPVTDNAAGLVILKEKLLEQGYQSSTRTLYSIFEHAISGGHSIYYRIHCTTLDSDQAVRNPANKPQDKNIRLFPVSNLPLDKVENGAVRTMLERYQQEHSNNFYGIYHGSERAGKVTMLD